LDVEIETEDINFFTPETFKSRGKKLSDGVYCFKLKKDDGGCGTDQYRYRALTCNAECCLKDLIAKATRELVVTKKEKMLALAGEIRTMIEGIKTDAVLGVDVSPNFEMLNSLLRASNCNC
jgi:hypothetical protein